MIYARVRARTSITAGYFERGVGDIKDEFTSENQASMNMNSGRKEVLVTSSSLFPTSLEYETLILARQNHTVKLVQ